MTASRIKTTVHAFMLVLSIAGAGYSAAYAQSSPATQQAQTRTLTGEQKASAIELSARKHKGSGDSW
jgi:hypothetical protein